MGRRQGHLAADVLREICAKVGVDEEKFLAGIEQQPIKDRLRAITQELIDRGGFGSPTMFVGGDDMYFGNDRMPLIREAVLRTPSRAGPHPFVMIRPMRYQKRAIVEYYSTTNEKEFPIPCIVRSDPLQQYSG